MFLKQFVVFEKTLKRWLMIYVHIFGILKDEKNSFLINKTQML